MRAAFAFTVLMLGTSLALADDPPNALAAALALDAGAPADPNAPTVGSSLDRTEAHVGDALTLTVTAVARAAIVDTVKIPKPDLGKFEILESSEADKDLGDGKKSRRLVLQIAAYELGEFEIPAIAVEYGGGSSPRKIETAPIPVAIRKVVDDPKAEMLPLARTRDVRVEDKRPVFALMGAGAFVALVIILLVVRALVRRRRRAPAVVAPKIVRPPHEVALERLRELRRRGGFERDGYRPFHFELAEVLRGYLGARYGFDSLEQTTTELLSELERVRRAPVIATVGDATTTNAAPVLSDEDLDRIRVFLVSSDLVKFAKAPADDASAVELLDSAEAIVRSTTPELANVAKVANG